MLLKTSFALAILAALTVSVVAQPTQQLENFPTETGSTKHGLFWPRRPTAPPDMVTRIKLYALFARIAFYDLTTAWDCEVCKHEDVKDTQVVKIFDYEPTRLYLYVAVNHRLKVIVVSFRGTHDFKGWLVDFDIIKTSVSELGVGVSVHAGFYKSYMAGHDVVKEQVEELIGKYPSYELHVVGHSMGAALASLQAQALAHQFPQKKIKLTTYGQPRVGNQAYATMVNKLSNLDAIRFVHASDPVPHGPPEGLGFYHPDREVWCPKSKGKEYVVCDAGMEDWACSRHVIPDLNLDNHKMLPGLEF